MDDQGTGPRTEGPLLRVTDRIVLALDWSGRLISVLCLVVLFLALFVNIVLRSFTGAGITWAYEIHVLLLPWMIAGGIVIASAQSRHISISLLPGLLPPAGRRSVGVLIQTIVAVICVSVLWTSQPVLQASQFQRLSTFGLTQVWGYSSMIYAFAGMAVISILHAVVIASGDTLRSDDATVQSLS